MADVPDQETLASGVRVHRFTTGAMRLPGVYPSSRSHHPPFPDPLGVRELSASLGRNGHIPPCTQLDRQQCSCAAPLIANGSRFGLALTLHDFSHVCATKRLMRMGSPCEGPAVARSCLALPPTMDLLWDHRSPPLRR